MFLTCFSISPQDGSEARNVSGTARLTLSCLAVNTVRGRRLTASTLHSYDLTLFHDMDHVCSGQLTGRLVFAARRYTSAVMQCKSVNFGVSQIKKSYFKDTLQCNDVQ